MYVWTGTSSKCVCDSVVCWAYYVASCFGACLFTLNCDFSLLVMLIIYSTNNNICYYM